jgi:hypothetical protein
MLNWLAKGEGDMSISLLIKRLALTGDPIAGLSAGDGFQCNAFGFRPWPPCFQQLTKLASAFSFHFIPKLWRGTIRLVWNAEVVRSGWPLDSPLYAVVLMRASSPDRNLAFSQNRLSL